MQFTLHGEFFLGVIGGLKLAIHLGLDNMVLETDSLQVMNKIKKGLISTFSRFGSLVVDIFITVILVQLIDG